uniref:Uncharacterized protein n=1 Tax=Arundo donax TaxID=35708 RepID=A0A0A8Y3Q6_ARUDO
MLVRIIDSHLFSDAAIMNVPFKQCTKLLKGA